MLTPLLIESLKKTLKHHQSLYEIAVRKTTIVQKSDINGLQELLKEEQSHLSAIQILERKRKEIVERMKKDLSIEMEELTISTLLSYLKVAEKEEIRVLQELLIKQIEELKYVNVLNQQLLMHSLHFVNLNLDLLAPIQESPNYTKSLNEELNQPGRSLFNSQA